MLSSIWDVSTLDERVLKPNLALREVYGVTLDDRKMQVLAAIVRDYVATAEPVSSRTIARKYHLGVSPATIRNEMSDLEDLGFLEQPHTSAGRVPSDRGYRLYVDELFRMRQALDTEILALRDSYVRRAEQVESLMHTTAHILSEMTTYLSVVSGPSIRSAAFKALYMHLVSPGKALLVLLTDIGLTQNAMVEVPRDSDEQDLREIGELLTRRLAGTPLDRLSGAVTGELESLLKKHRMVLEQILEMVKTVPRDESERGLYVEGMLSIMTQPEFQKAEKVRLLLQALADEELLARIFSGSTKENVHVAIGEENKVIEVRDCSLVWTTFSTQGAQDGILGVIGPKRMDYDRVISLVSGVKQQLMSALTKTS
jgi:heat-inducible transcriptional repressor